MYLTTNNILMNNVREQQFENSGQLIGIVKKKLSKILIRTSLSQEVIEQVNSLGTRKKIVQSLHHFWTNSSVSQ